MRHIPSSVRWGVAWALLAAGCGEPPRDASEAGDALGIPADRIFRAQRRIPGRYIVVLRESDGTTRAALQALTTALPRAVADEDIFERAMSGFVAQLSEAEALALARHPAVEFLEEDGRVEELQLVGGPFPDPDPWERARSWGLDRIDQRSLPLDGHFQPANSGAGVHVYQLESGGLVRRDDPEFRAPLAPGAPVEVCTQAECTNLGLGTDSRVSWDRQGSAVTAHANFVAGIIGSLSYGIAKEVRIHSTRFDSTISAAIREIDWIAGNHVKPAVANLSWGIRFGSVSIDRAVERLLGAGVVVVVGAGNNREPACTWSPGRVPGALTVGASKADDSVVASFNYGPCIDLYAPGYRVTSMAAAMGRSASGSGTSYSAPHVVGAVATYLSQYPAATPAEVHAAVVAVATPDVITGDLRGGPNRLLFVDPAGW